MLSASSNGLSTRALVCVAGNPRSVVSIGSSWPAAPGLALRVEDRVDERRQVEQRLSGGLVVGLDDGLDPLGDLREDGRLGAGLFERRDRVS